ncbi:hypothetical protein, partial [Stenotrophomonas sp. HMWF003]|uniref:hypothetical protein n=1 Tax=Stenotrophomonas sp. HMWF003 TaxID=2056840 RepID=UPI001C62ECCD
SSCGLCGGPEGQEDGQKTSGERLRAHDVLSGVRVWSFRRGVRNWPEYSLRFHLAETGAGTGVAAGHHDLWDMV